MKVLVTELEGQRPVKGCACGGCEVLKWFELGALGESEDLCLHPSHHRALVFISFFFFFFGRLMLLCD